MNPTLVSVLNDLHIPWPNADVDRIREAAQFWSNLGDAVEDAMYAADNQAKALCAGNSGAAINAFEQYWKKVYMDPGVGTFPMLLESCRDLAARCREYADAVEEAEHRLEEKLVEAGVLVGGGAFLTLASGGLSDLFADWAASGIETAGWTDIEILGTQISAILGRMATSSIVSFVDTWMGQASKNGTAVLLRDKGGEVSTAAIAHQALLSLGIGAFTGGGAAVGSAAAAKGAEVAFEHIPGDVGEWLPSAVYATSRIPDATETPAGKALSSLAANYAAGKIDGQGGPKVQSIISDAIDARLEAAVETSSEADTGKK